MIELLRCPFCGGEAMLEEVRRDPGPDDVRFSVGCRDSADDHEGFPCIGYMSVMTYPRRIDAANAWNRRIATVERVIQTVRSAEEFGTDD
jgi:hypothetical protein